MRCPVATPARNASPPQQLHFVWEQQWHVTSRRDVHEPFQHKNSPSDTRQRHLAHDLGTVHDSVPIATLTNLTPPRLAKAAHPPQKPSSATSTNSPTKPSSNAPAAKSAPDVS